MIKSILVGFGIVFLLFIATLYLLTPRLREMNKKRKKYNQNKDEAGNK